MLKLHESDLVAYYVQTEKKLLICDWTEGHDYTDTGFERDILKMSEIMKTYQINKILDDSLLVAYPIIPRIQTWIAEVLTPVFIEVKLTKYALVKPHDIISDLSNEQIFDEIHQLNQDWSYLSKIFHERADAIEWLLA